MEMYEGKNIRLLLDVNVAEDDIVEMNLDKVSVEKLTLQNKLNQAN